MEIPFKEFPKMSRLFRDIIITEKIDGTNASIFIPDLPTDLPEGVKMLVGSRTRWITPGDDNFGFAKWCKENEEELLKLGPGHHFGEWYGKGIQRGYGLDHKRFALFNTHRWGNNPDLPSCVSVVPVLYTGPFNTVVVDSMISALREHGSYAAEGFKKPEGIITFHTAANIGFKTTIEKDDTPKSLVNK